VIIIYKTLVLCGVYVKLTNSGTLKYILSYLY